MQILHCIYVATYISKWNDWESFETVKEVENGSRVWILDINVKLKLFQALQIHLKAPLLVSFLNTSPWIV